MKVSIGVSNHHVHLTEEHFHILFGEDRKLNRKKDLNQPTQFASDCFVTIQTEKAQLEQIRVLGGFRNYTQVEISKTDAYRLGIDPPIRDSGDLEGSAPITILGPAGTLKLENGCIIANRHIHITPKQQALYGLEGKKEVSVFIDGPKSGILFHVSLKVEEHSYFEMHLDTDDANAFQVKQGTIATILEGDDESQYMSKM